MNSLSWSAGSALAPILGGLVQQHLGNTALWLGCALVGAVTAGGQLLAGPLWERRAAALRATSQPVAAEAETEAEALEAIPPIRTAEPAADVPPAELDPARPTAK